MNINPICPNAGKNEKDTQQYDLPFRLSEGFTIIFPNAAFRKIDGKVGFGSFICWCKHIG